MRNLIIIMTAILLFSGCKMLPSTDYKREGKGNSYNKIIQNYNKIIIDGTTKEQLKELGFHPSATTNVKILNYLDITNKFIPRDNFVADEKVMKCINSNNRCIGYNVSLENINKDRYGSVFLDLFGFRKNTKTTGWRFNATILLLDDTVVYKIYTSQPNILEIEKEKTPLGPLQNAESIIKHAVYE